MLPTAIACISVLSLNWGRPSMFYRPEYTRPVGSSMNTVCHLLCDLCAKENYMGYLKKTFPLYPGIRVSW